LLNLYRHARHGLRARLSFVKNWLRLSLMRRRLKRGGDQRELVGILLLEHFGDIIACEPIVRHVRTLKPNAFIVWGVRGAYRELIESNPLIDETMVLHCLSERLWLARAGLFDQVIDLHLPGRYCSLCRTPAKKTVGCGNITLDNFYAFGGILSAFAQSAGFPPMVEQPRVYLDSVVRARIDALSLPQEFVAIHAISNHSTKDWQPGKWRELIERLHGSCGMCVIELGLVSALENPPDASSYRNLCGKLSLLETAEVIRRASLFVGIDSGPAHFANALGTYGILLLGRHLGFDRYMPFSRPYMDGANCELMYADGLVSEISVERVLEAILRSRERARGNERHPVPASVSVGVGP